MYERSCGFKRQSGCDISLDYQGGQGNGKVVCLCMEVHKERTLSEYGHRGGGEGEVWGMSEYKILLGDSRTTLSQIPDNSVDCCITSPPYYGLRDYGTGKWIGGRPDCPHRRLSKASDKTITGHAQEEELKGNVGDAIYKTVCPLCGAVREDNQIGLEETPQEYIHQLMEVFDEVHRVLKPTGTFWLNIGDSYNGSGRGRGADGEVHFSALSAKQGTNKGSAQGVITKKVIDYCKPKDLIGIPWMLAFALRDSGWYLRQDIIWHKPNPMPEPVKDRCVKSHEYIFLLSKEPRYFFDYEAIQEGATTEMDQSITKIRFGGSKYGDNDDPHFATKSGKEWKPQTGESEDDLVRNKRDVWTVTPDSFRGAHFATFPPKLIEPMVLAGCPPGGGGFRSVHRKRNNGRSCPSEWQELCRLRTQ